MRVDWILEMFAARSMARFTHPFLQFIAGILKKDLAHPSLSQFLHLLRVAILLLTLLMADIRSPWSSLNLRPSHLSKEDDPTEYDADKDPLDRNQKTPSRVHPLQSVNLPFEKNVLLVFCSQRLGCRFSMSKIRLFLLSRHDADGCDRYKDRAPILIPLMHPRNSQERPFAMTFRTLFHRIGTIRINRKQIRMSCYRHA